VNFLSLWSLSWKATLYKRILALFVFIVVVGFNSDALAIDSTSSSVKPIQKLDKSGDLTLTVQASRPTLSAGSGFGLTADIKNVSSSRIELSSRNTVLMLPPELEGLGTQGATAFFALFPTDTVDTNAEAYDRHLTLEPGDEYTVAWSWDQDPPNNPTQHGIDVMGHHLSLPMWVAKIDDTIASELQFLFFPPGDYKVNMVIRYHIMDQPADTLQTAIQSVLVHVAAPQSVIIFGAMIGGILGYVISRIYSRTALTVSGLIGAPLLSAIITILLARIGETQFLVRVSVSDFWGAIAIGFIASFTGVRILNSFVPAEKAAAQETGDPELKTPAVKRTVATGQPKVANEISRSAFVAPADSMTQTKDTMMKRRPNIQEVESRAYSISEGRRKNGAAGDALSDWVRAEKELKDELRADSTVESRQKRAQRVPFLQRILGRSQQAQDGKLRNKIG
jgi:hypothetical protein